MRAADEAARAISERYYPDSQYAVPGFPLALRRAFRAGARWQRSQPIEVTDAIFRGPVRRFSMKISDEDRGELERAIHAGMAPNLMTLAGAIGSQEHYNEFLHNIADAILASDVFARIVREQAVLNNPQITAEVAAYHANPSDAEEEGGIMPIEYRVVVGGSVVFTSDHRAIAEGYAHGLKLRGEKSRLEVVAVGNNS